jgi:hypothetical protein
LGPVDSLFFWTSFWLFVVFVAVPQPAVTASQAQHTATSAITRKSRTVLRDDIIAPLLQTIGRFFYGASG